MLSETFKTIAQAARAVLRNWQSMLLVAIVYASLLAVLYFFVVVREATFVQVSLTFASAIVAPLLFFILQAMIAAGPEGLGAAPLLKKSLTNFWKLILITLPLIALAVLIVYLLAKTQARFDASVREAAAMAPRRSGPTAAASESAIDWKTALLSTIRYLSLGLVLPLMAIHLWLATARGGLGHVLRRFGQHVSRAFAPQSVLTYVVGFLIFGVAPYFLLFKTTQTKSAWLELLLLIARLIVVFALTLLGWMITVRALGRFSADAIPRRAEETT